MLKFSMGKFKLVRMEGNLDLILIFANDFRVYLIYVDTVITGIDWQPDQNPRLSQKKKNACEWERFRLQHCVSASPVGWSVSYRLRNWWRAAIATSSTTEEELKLLTCHSVRRLEEQKQQ